MNIILLSPHVEVLKLEDIILKSGYALLSSLFFYYYFLLFVSVNSFVFFLSSSNGVSSGRTGQPSTQET